MSQSRLGGIRDEIQRITVCPEAVASGLQDTSHVWTWADRQYTSEKCARCDHVLEPGGRIEDMVFLLAEIDRLNRKVAGLVETRRLDEALWKVS